MGTLLFVVTLFRCRHFRPGLGEHGTSIRKDTDFFPAIVTENYTSEVGTRDGGRIVGDNPNTLHNTHSIVGKSIERRVIDNEFAEDVTNTMAVGAAMNEAEISQDLDVWTGVNTRYYLRYAILPRDDPIIIEKHHRPSTKLHKCWIINRRYTAYKIICP